MVKITRSPVAAWTEVGLWHLGQPAPNGCVPRQRERYTRTVEVYAADYYGTGAKLYMDIRCYLHTEHSIVYLGMGSDGHTQRIRDRAELAGVVLPN
jgi:hypothetical protein